MAGAVDIGEKDSTRNVTVGDVMVEDTHGSYLRSHGPLIASLGLKDVIVVATGDVVLAAAKDRAQDVKLFVSRLRQTERTEAISRPSSTALGHFADGRFGPVLPGQAHHREARTPASAADPCQAGGALGGGQRRRAGNAWRRSPDPERQHVDLHPLGAVHRLENPGPDPLVLIEVQSGDYIGEDDIVRLSDDYGRK